MTKKGHTEGHVCQKFVLVQSVFRRIRRKKVDLNRILLKKMYYVTKFLIRVIEWDFFLDGISQQGVKLTVSMKTPIESSNRRETYCSIVGTYCHSVESFWGEK